jgi:transcription elongation GreA/GreB family factor
MLGIAMPTPETIDKRALLDQLISKLQAEADAIGTAAKASHEAATHEESRAEDQHDTRGLEASYLAGAQAQRAAELLALISTYRMLPLRELGPSDLIVPGALIELEQEETGRKSRYFLVPRGGGATLSHQGGSIQVIAPQSPLGEALMGRKQGEDFEVETQGTVREYRVVSVR